MLGIWVNILLSPQGGRFAFHSSTYVVESEQHALQSVNPREIIWSPVLSEIMVIELESPAYLKYSLFALGTSEFLPPW